MDRGGEDGYQCFNAPVKVSGHPVCRGYIHLGLGGGQFMAVTKAGNSGVFQKSTYNGFHPYVFTYSGDARPQAADASDYKVYTDPCLGCLVEGVNDLRIHKGVHFYPDIYGRDSELLSSFFTEANERICLYPPY